MVKFPSTLTLPDGNTPASTKTVTTSDSVITTIVIIETIDPTSNKKITITTVGTIDPDQRTITVIWPEDRKDELPNSKLLTVSVTFKDITNPIAVIEAGGFGVTTYYDTYVIDSGETTTSFTPEKSTISGTEVIVLPPVTSGTDSEYKLIFIPSSTVPQLGYIYIRIPIELIMVPDQVLSGGICTQPGFTCECVVNDDLGLGTNESYGLIIVHLDNTVSVPAK